MPEELSSDTLSRSYWWVTHRAMLFRGVWLLCIGSGAVLCMIALAMFVDTYIFKGFAHRTAMARFAAHARTMPLQSPSAQDLMITTLGAVPANNTIYDLYAQVSNPNQAWRAEVRYAFIVNGVAVSEQTGFIMPGETKYFLRLNIETPSAPSVQWRITSLRWYRAGFADKAAIAEKYHLSTDNFSFANATESGVTQAVPISTVSFDLRNSGGHTYREVRIPIVLLHDTTVVAVNYLTTGTLAPNETRALEAKWYHHFEGVNAFSISPELNVFDADAFLR